ncbi:hypothetical protein N8Z26_02380 [Burkholderiales bacterium]|nr:hypothetical protein [Burkholderiales bacterium]
MISLPAQAAGFNGTATIELLDTLSHTQHVKLIRPLEFTDTEGNTWTAEANRVISLNLLTDEIRLNRPLPNPFDYLKTIILYNGQVEHSRANWRDIQSVVYEALIADGLQEHWAKMIYASVRAEGWRWEPVESSCFRSCHANSPTLRWRPVPDYEQLLKTIDWILVEIPGLPEINDRVDALIIKTGPHIFGQ